MDCGWRAGLRNTDEITESRGLTEEEFYTKRAHSVALRKVIARQVSKDVSASSGFNIEVEDREMAMLTANEMGNDTQDVSDQNIKPIQNDEDSQN